MSERLQGHRTKLSSDVDAVTKSGRLFHTRDAATGNARSPTVDSRDGGTTRAGVDAERRRRRVPRSATRRKSLARFTTLIIHHPLTLSFQD